MIVHQDSDSDLTAVAAAVGVLRHVSLPRYESPINTCPLCGTPTSGVLCTPCATR